MCGVKRNMNVWSEPKGKANSGPAKSLTPQREGVIKWHMPMVSEAYLAYCAYVSLEGHLP